jgi:hypothetical protein
MTDAIKTPEPIWPSYAGSHDVQTMDECGRVPYEASMERSGVCFGGFRPPPLKLWRLNPTKHMRAAWGSTYEK